MKKHLIVFILTLLCVSPAFAAKTMSEGANGRSSRYEGTFQNGDTGVVGSIALPCAGFSVSFFVGEGAGGSVELFASRDNTVAGGTSLGVIAATTVTSQVFRTAFPYLVVNVVAAPASGTARVWISCSQVAESGAGIAAAGGGLVGAHYWIENDAVIAADDCMLFGPGDFISGTSVACTTSAGNQRVNVSFPVGRTVVARLVTCDNRGAGVTGNPVFDIRWRNGATGDTPVDSVNGLTVPAANWTAPGVVTSAAINSTCPYTATGCLAALHVRTAPTGGAGFIVRCNALFEVI